MPPALSESRNTGTSPAWKPSTMSSRSRPCTPPCRNCDADAASSRGARSRRRPIATYWVNTSTESPGIDDGVEQLVERVELAGAAVRAARAGGGSCAGWLQICLSAVSSLSTRPAAGDALARHRSGRASRAPPPRRAWPARRSGARRGRSRSWAAGRARCRGRDLRRRRRNGRTRRARRSVATRVARRARRVRRPCGGTPRAARAGRGWSSRGSPTAR